MKKYRMSDVGLMEIGIKCDSVITMKANACIVIYFQYVKDEIKTK